MRSSREITRLGESGLTGRGRPDDPAVVYRVDPPVDSEELNRLFAAGGSEPESRNWGPVLARSLAFVCAYREGRLVGFVNVAWDGGVHGFILDTTVHPEMRRCGIGRQLVLRAASAARERNLEWLHVDFEPQLRSFYAGSGFSATEAGLMYQRAR